MSMMRNKEGIRLTEIEKDYSDGKTKQSFKDETDVNLIVQRHARMKTLSHLEQWGGQYGDLAGFDFQNAQNQIAKANTMFEELPASARNKFSNDPARFFEYVNDPENTDKLETELPELMKPGTRPLPEHKDRTEPAPEPAPNTPEPA